MPCGTSGDARPSFLLPCCPTCSLQADRPVRNWLSGPGRCEEDAEQLAWEKWTRPNLLGISEQPDDVQTGSHFKLADHCPAIHVELSLGCKVWTGAELFFCLEERDLFLA